MPLNHAYAAAIYLRPGADDTVDRSEICPCFKVTVYDLLEGVPRCTRGQGAFDAVLISLILAN